MMIAQQIQAVQNARRLPRVKVCRKWENLLFFSGHGCEDNFTGDPLAVGKVGKEITLEQAKELARECALILIDALQDELGSLDRFGGIVNAFALINCTDDFTQLDEVMDGFSETMISIFGERGIHTRMVAGTSALPFNIPVEIEMIVEVKP